MGKSKKKASDEPETIGDVTLDTKTVLKLEPEERANWLSKACRLATDGDLRVSQLYDILVNEKIAYGLPDKVGKRMHRTLLKHLSVFSEKQQTYFKAVCNSKNLQLARSYSKATGASGRKRETSKKGFNGR